MVWFGPWAAAGNQRANALFFEPWESARFNRCPALYYAAVSSLQSLKSLRRWLPLTRTLGWFMAGCAALPYYTAPTEGALASLTFDSKSRTGVPSFSDNYLRFSIYSCLGPDGFQVVEVPPKSSKSVQVRAEEPLRLSLFTEARGNSGTVYFSFVPQTGQSYRAIYTVLPGPAGADSMQITLLDGHENKLKFERGTKDWPRCGK
jgi:hypothetical protein